VLLPGAERAFACGGIIFNGQDARWPHKPRRSESVLWRTRWLCYRETFSTAKSDLIMASHSQFRRSVRRDVEAGTSRQSGATTTPTNHPEK
jgi:hypothetical protein